MTETMFNAAGWVLITVGALLFVGLFRLARAASRADRLQDGAEEDDRPARHRRH